MATTSSPTIATSIEIQELTTRLAKVEDQLGIVLFYLTKRGQDFNKGSFNISNWIPNINIHKPMKIQILYEEEDQRQQLKERGQELSVKTVSHISNNEVSRQEIELDVVDDDASLDDVELNNLELEQEDEDGEEKINEDNDNYVNDINIEELSIPPCPLKLEIEEAELIDINSTEELATSDPLGFNLDDNQRVRRHDECEVEVPSLACELCLKLFGSLQALKCHQLDVHGNGRKYKCFVCDSVFNLCDQLKAHMNSVHSVEFVNNNIHCEDSVGSRSNYIDGINNGTLFHKEIERERIHRKKTSYKQTMHRCKICGRYLSSSYSLKRHIDDVHRQVNKHPCPNCHRTFKNIIALKMHQNFHKPAAYLKPPRRPCKRRRPSNNNANRNQEHANEEGEEDITKERVLEIINEQIQLIRNERSASFT